MPNDLERAKSALFSIPPDLDRDEWVKVGMAVHAAGLSLEDFKQWSSGAENYVAADAEDTWRSFKPDKGVTAATLYWYARKYGWTDTTIPSNVLVPTAGTPEAQSTVRIGMGAVEIWRRCVAATDTHPYITQKKASGVPLNNLRVVPLCDELIILGESMVGALVVPVMDAKGTITSLQFIAPPDVAARLKAKGKSSKLNLPHHPVRGWFTVGDVVDGGTVYITEGIGQAWACWQATGVAAAVCFGAGNMGRVAKSLRDLDPEAQVVVVPDVGKESLAAQIALEVSGRVVVMPDGWVQNSDVHDLAQRDGMDVLKALLINASVPPQPDQRFKLLSAAELRSLPALGWRISGVLPSTGLAAIYGASSSGKSFLGFDMAAAIASGQNWFGHRVEHAPVVYVALEGEAGFKLRGQAWEAHRGHALPCDLHMILQPFRLTNEHDVDDLAAVIPTGAVVFIDTLNRAAPTADENNSRDMGRILEAAKRLQSLTNGLVVLIHHPGKDAARGLRGHSSLGAALDASIEVTRKGDHRKWSVAKAKDGDDCVAHAFRLEVEVLGTNNYGESITSCTVRPQISAAVVMKVKSPQGGNQGPVYECIKDLLKNGVLGRPGVPPDIPSIESTEAVVAASAKLTCPTDKRTSRTKEAIEGLINKGLLGSNGTYIWHT